MKNVNRRFKLAIIALGGGCLTMGTGIGLLLPDIIQKLKKKGGHEYESCKIHSQELDH